ncbi:hypothetical protein B0J13DRAFT_37011 [Dactylonectria estremocensis]|uniref:Uncharacterized protein n=1 Tax=Dactylonectria estremocensis TaxID=1079267 RepID=A0A9P9JF88_9HYPO|nr:hypothetical protein B0J13DRAFT_37011 [Dactylonectria estremocensis]
MSGSDSAAYQYFGLSCSDGGSFYICEDAEIEFMGCCTSDPCSDGSGVCPDGKLRASTFNKDSYEDMPPQECAEADLPSLWYTCAFITPPFLGCCAENPCVTGSCSRSNVTTAVLSSDEGNRQDFLEPDGADSSTTSSSTSSASASASTSAAADNDDGSVTLSAGAVAGIAAGAGVIALLLLGFLIWKFWWVPRKRKQQGKGFSPVSRSAVHPEQHQEQPGTPGTYFTSQQSPMSHYQQSFASTPTVVPHYPSGVSMDQYGKLSPQTPGYDRPISMAYSDVSSIPNRGYSQAYSPPPMIPVQEMDGTSSLPPQELSAGDYNHQSPAQSPGFSPGMNHGVDQGSHPK